MSAIGDILGPGGVLASAIAGYESRPSQLQMAERVRQACEQLGSAGRSLAASVVDRARPTLIDRD